MNRAVRPVLTLRTPPRFGRRAVWALLAALGLFGLSFAIDAAAAGNVLRVLAEHAVMGFDAATGRGKASEMVHESRSGALGALGRFLIKAGRRLARP